MKIRSGFVSNSSSASFIVEIKSDSFQNLCTRLQESLPMFSKENVLSKLNEKKEYIEKFQNEKEKEYSLKEVDRVIQEINDFKELSYSDEIKLSKKERSFYWYKRKKHQERLVDALVFAKHWSLYRLDDGYFGINFGGPSIYNDWGEIRMHKEMMEIVAYCAFMKHDFRTRIENHQGSF